MELPVIRDVYFFFFNESGSTAETQCVVIVNYSIVDNSIYLLMWTTLVTIVSREVAPLHQLCDLDALVDILVF